MSARALRRSARRRRQLRVLAWAGTILAISGIVLGLLHRHEALRRREAERREAIRAAAAAAQARVLQGERDRLARELDRIQTPPARAGDLLAALARLTPLDVSLREVSCAADRFVIRGHAYAGGGAAGGPLPRFQRELFGRGLGWQLADPGPGAGGGDADFTWHGLFVREAPSSPLPANPEEQLAQARQALPRAETFDDWFRVWVQPWHLTLRSDEIWPALDVRHYALAYARPALGAWSAIVAALQAAAAEPGLTVDRLVLAAPEGAADFSRAQLTLTARMRP